RGLSSAWPRWVDPPAHRRVPCAPWRHRALARCADLAALMDRRAFIAAVLSGLAMPRGLGAARARLNILTWNIWMMPPWTFQSPRNEQRAEAIAAELLKLDVDVLCLQKAFHKPARTVLERALSAR